VGRSAATATRAGRAGLTATSDLDELLHRCDVVLSICPPASAEALADDLVAAIARTGFRGIVVEANAISVSRTARIAARLHTAGADVVDGAIIGPPPVDGGSARLYLAGDATPVHTVADLFHGTSVEPVELGRDIGGASAVKMAFGGYQKASRTLAAVAHALAAHHGVTAELLAEANRMPSNALADPDYIPSVAARAWRWTGELHEVAESLSAARLPSELAAATATVLHRWEQDRDDWSLDVQQALGHLVEPVEQSLPIVPTATTDPRNS
jgi:3-hydroxyisobutyrate dehydrogenase-like beta-hydroxyacid dehydrogenase